MKLLLTIFTLISLGLITSGCNMMEGMGKDIKAGGKKIENAAEKHKG